MLGLTIVPSQDDVVLWNHLDLIWIGNFTNYVMCIEIESTCHHNNH